MRWTFCWLAMSVVPAWDEPSLADDPAAGTLVVIGGNERPDNAELFERMIDCAGGRRESRFVIFRCASRNDDDARHLCHILVRYGVGADRLAIVDLVPENAHRQAASPQVLDQVRRATGAFFTGGDQLRITRSLIKPDGTPTAALVALRELWRRGGVVAGTSAGAAMQSSRMIAVSGLPDKSLDEGMDALDFGVGADPRRRGLLVTEGLGFFDAGIIDQHFSEYRGRLGRLARALIYERLRFGFGVDENTAMIVSHDGRIEIVGTGNVTVVDASEASCEDGPLGCRIANVRLSRLQRGDRFESDSGTAVVRPEKKPIREGAQDFHGNHALGDIDAGGALPWALVAGLAENTSSKQVGTALRYNQGLGGPAFGHGYRFTFFEDQTTGAYAGYVDDWYSYAITGVRLDVEPIVSTLQDPRAALPADFPAADDGKALAGLWFRGILLTDEQGRLRPDDSMTRAELANAIAQSVHLQPPPGHAPMIADVPEQAAWADDVRRVVDSGLMKLDGDARFRPGDAVTRLEAARAFVGVARHSRSGRLAVDPIRFSDHDEVPASDREAVFAAIRASLLRSDNFGRFRPVDPLKRREAAEAIYVAVGFSW
jgi:cyanophycinase